MIGEPAAHHALASARERAAAALQQGKVVEPQGEIVHRASAGAKPDVDVCALKFAGRRAADEAQDKAMNPDVEDQIAHGLVRVGRTEILARTLMAFVILIPFFAFWETDRVMGDHKLFKLFFRRTA